MTRFPGKVLRTGVQAATITGEMLSATSFVGSGQGCRKGRCGGLCFSCFVFCFYCAFGLLMYRIEPCSCNLYIHIYLQT